MSSSSRRMRPLVERKAPDNRLMSVVLPAPFGPMMPCTLLGAKRNVTSLTAMSPPKARDKPSVSIALPFMARRSRVTAATGAPAASAARFGSSQPAMPRGAPSTAAISKTPSASDQLAATGPTRLSVLSTSSTARRQRAEDRAEQGADAAKHHHHDRDARLTPAEQIGRHIAVDGRIEHAASSRKRAGDHKAQQLVDIRVEIPAR